MDLQKVFNIILFVIFIVLDLTMGIFIFIAFTEDGKNNLLSAVFGALMVCMTYGIYKLLPFVRV